MKLTGNRRRHLQTLIDFTFEHGNALQKAAAAVMQHALKNSSEPNPKYMELEMGKRIRCKCGNESCYRMIEVADRELFLYLDESDVEAPYYAFTLPQKYEIVERK